MSHETAFFVDMDWRFTVRLQISFLEHIGRSRARSRGPAIEGRKRILEEHVVANLDGYLRKREVPTSVYGDVRVCILEELDGRLY